MTANLTALVRLGATELPAEILSLTECGNCDAPCTGPFCSGFCRAAVLGELDAAFDAALLDSAAGRYELHELEIDA
ncbi:hypothetical protein Ga0074812_1472 [Parafrankia irregularis]|uniref:Uncharacterized protein n=1 Tax=Parafrankia irregularis TaxID=795642 RepID=A0A0S4QZS7_9ACTN|nr:MULTISPECIES: hypothetical protein [Parafrankia]MBE3206682.1 hypothetical protein [Parafrankia sp. CH37]CUU60756.1 hypothetical protein Ga0074812_1472 [Parafrankia irregularis]